MAKHPFEGFDGLIARAAAILEGEGQPKSWKVKNRSWYAQQIIVANDLMLAAIAEGDASGAARWGVRLGGLIREAGAPGLNPRTGAGGKKRAAAIAARNLDLRRTADVLRAQHPEWNGNKSRIARAIERERGDPEMPWQKIRKLI